MAKRMIRLGGVELGQGQPAVCIPVMGCDMSALLVAVKAARDAGADVIELRADALAELPASDSVREMCCIVREYAPGIPLLFTLRTQRDGGSGCTDAASYEALLMGVCKSGMADAIDVELSVGESTFARIASAAHAEGIVVVGSSHDFSATPSQEEICARLAAMQRLGADVCKIAVMPQNRMDVLTLMCAAAESDKALLAPVIAIAMGPMGVLTRLGGEAFGSCLTFGAALQASAPGQIHAERLRSVLKTIHEAMG